jgi:hypothetical protein
MIKTRSVARCNGLQHCNTCNAFATEILKIKGDRPKVNKSGLKRSAEPVNPARRKYREGIMADSCSFLQEGFWRSLFLAIFNNFCR